MSIPRKILLSVSLILALHASEAESNKFGAADEDAACLEDNDPSGKCKGRWRLEAGHAARRLGGGLRGIIHKLCFGCFETQETDYSDSESAGSSAGTFDASDDDEPLLYAETTYYGSGETKDGNDYVEMVYVDSKEVEQKNGLEPSPDGGSISSDSDLLDSVLLLAELTKEDFLRPTDEVTNLFYNLRTALSDEESIDQNTGESPDSPLATPPSSNLERAESVSSIDSDGSLVIVQSDDDSFVEVHSDDGLE